MIRASLFNILWNVRDCTRAIMTTAVTDAIVYLHTLLPVETASQLTFQGGWAEWGVLHLISAEFVDCERATELVSLIIERGRDTCGTAVLMSLVNINGETALHECLYDLTLTKIIIREFPPSLVVQDIEGNPPLCPRGEISALLRAATSAYLASDFVTLINLCDGSSPYLLRPPPPLS